MTFHLSIFGRCVLPKKEADLAWASGAAIAAFKSGDPQFPEDKLAWRPICINEDGFIKDSANGVYSW